MYTNLSQLNRKLNALSVFRKLLETPVVSSFQKLIYAMDEGSLSNELLCYGAFVNAIYNEGGNLSQFINKWIQTDDNIFLQYKIKQTIISQPICQCLDEELDVLQELSQLSPEEVQGEINYDGFLPRWDRSQIDLRKEYKNMIDAIPTCGYGMFAVYSTYTVKAGSLVPVKTRDTQTLDQLYGYHRERNQVLENTRALVNGKPCCNVLLYGDAGTGKSSTIKACAQAFFDQGLRLVEFDKSQLEEIPKVIELLSVSPLKFIFYIDDLSFGQNDDTFCQLKGILEGNVTSYQGNIAIYATSNRRHLIKESMESRSGNELHLNDTLQETMSLSARFGLTITFSKPEKDLFLEIVDSLAKEYGIEMDASQLHKKAEAFAIRSNGRSPRTAKQFIFQVSMGLK